MCGCGLLTLLIAVKLENPAGSTESSNVPDLKLMAPDVHLHTLLHCTCITNHWNDQNLLITNWESWLGNILDYLKQKGWVLYFIMCLQGLTALSRTVSSCSSRSSSFIKRRRYQCPVHPFQDHFSLLSWKTSALNIKVIILSSKVCTINCKFHKISIPWMMEIYRFISLGFTYSYFAKKKEKFSHDALQFSESRVHIYCHHRN